MIAASTTVNALPMHVARQQWEQAESYVVTYNWHVIALHNPLPDGNCSCGDPACPPRSRGKHPRMGKWQNEATTDPAKIRKWAQSGPGEHRRAVGRKERHH